MSDVLNQSAPLEREHPLLADVQCNVLAPHRRIFSSHLFVQLPAAGGAAVDYSRAWGGRVTSADVTAREQAGRVGRLKRWEGMRKFTDNAVVNALRKALPEGWIGPASPRPEAGRDLVKSFMLSHLGLEKLGGVAVTNVIAEKEFAGRAADFEPMAQSQGDWCRMFAEQKIEAHILLAADDPQVLGEARADELGVLQRAGGILLGERQGRTVKNAEGRAVEHFGYADGISNPHCLVDELASASRQGPLRHYSHHYPVGNFLFRLPTTTAAGAPHYGSFMVFQQIEQHVAAFERLRRSENVDRLVGRDPAGRPIEFSPAGAGGENDFAYPEPEGGGGGRCPFHAHIRKANPRPKGLSHGQRRVIFPRRGMLYGEREFDTDRNAWRDPLPAERVGLLFMGYMGSISGQFVKMQHDWFRSVRFPAPSPDFDPALERGPDRLVGLKPSDPRAVTTVRGGAYFFVPPLSWLRAL